MYFLNKNKKKCKTCFFIMVLLFNLICFSQNITKFQEENTSKNKFWKKVQLGGSLNLNIGSGYTNIALSPNAIYNINNFFSFGVGLQGSYVAVRNNYNSLLYGPSLIGLINPIEQVQFSIELEELKVNRSYNTSLKISSNHFWNTGLFLGAGYKSQNITIGARYDILYNENKNVYNNAFMPFFRIYF